MKFSTEVGGFSLFAVSGIDDSDEESVDSKGTTNATNDNTFDFYLVVAFVALAAATLLGSEPVSSVASSFCR